ncbi:alpha/beta hydrolase family protein [Streptomyces sp. TYQ1024]|uniref:alpha/beta hydrolase n=1 Tax=Streptomyces sp. TYQ1024 TaxID=2762559 RepID=UPI001EE62814|nr:alpha/beta hydrolase [Streptomyces sp. TYQ1024]UKW31204.1 alpha/beta hydrolase family protein [Streptomyces sp. TYQ1024]
MKAAKPMAVVDAGNAWDKLSGKYAAYSRDCSRYVHVPLVENWRSGLGAESAASYLGKVSQDLKVAQQELDAIGAVLRAAGEAFLAHQGRLKNLLAEASESGFTVHSNGSLSAPDISAKGLPPAAAGAAQKAQAERMKNIADGIAQVMRDADHADKEYADAIKKFVDTAHRCAGGNWQTGLFDLDTAKNIDQNLLTEIGMPDKKATPEAVNAWWKGLPPELRRSLLDDHPYILGNRDGIPAEDRDEGNRAYLPILLRELERKYDAASGDARSDLKDKIEGLEGLRDKLSSNGSSGLRPYLLGIDDEGNGRAIVSYGNPDTAKNVSAYVPGLNTKLSGHFADSDVQRADDVARMAGRVDPKSSTASIVWLGYDAPQLKPGSQMLDVTWEDRAKAGAASYNGFLQGIHATHEGGAPHVTALGHSYGSLAVGKASQQGEGLPADDVILVGSPGTGVDRASDLGVGADHVYVGAAENDQVTNFPPSFEQADHWFDYIAPGSEFGTKHAAFGVDPASKNFGGHRFSVAAGEDTGLSGLLTGDLPAHSVYFKENEGGDSLRNIALVVTGHGDHISVAAPR